MDAKNKALQNPLILENIFLQANPNGQKEWRVVSQLWRNSSLEKWRKAVVIQIDLDKKAALKTRHSLEEFLELCEGGKEEAYRISELPFQRFRLCGGESRVTINLHDLGNPLQKLFWGIHSPALKYLELNGIHSKQTFSETLKWILREGCVNLEEFKSVDSIFSNYEEDELEKRKPAEEAAQLTRGNNFTTLTLQNPRFFVSNSREGSIYMTWDIPSCDVMELCDVAPNLKVIFYDLQDTRKFQAAMPVAKRKIVKFIKVKCSLLKKKIE